jgi:DNA-binding GntR family transcriptional regulator
MNNSQSKLTDELPKGAAADTAYRKIRSDIISGVLEEGERLTEERISKKLGMSRTPVREALGRLTIEGFVERSGGYTTRVARFPADEAEQIFQIREMLEAYAAERAARMATPQDIIELRQLAEAILQNTPPKTKLQYQNIANANEQFHKKIVETARSPRLTALMSMAFDVGMVVRTYGRYTEEELVRSARHHLEIVEAITAHAPSWASNVMRTHIRAAEATISKSLEIGGKEFSAQERDNAPIDHLQ